MKLDIKLFGVHKRDEMISNTVERLGLSYETDVFYDNRPLGGSVLPMSKLTWLSDIEPDVTHRLVLQDDVYVCDNFREICTKMITAHPKAVFSLFPYQYMQKDFEVTHTPYVDTNTLSGVAIIMPVEYIKDCFEFIDETFTPMHDDDWSINQWCIKNGILRLTTIPSVVQHLGDDSLLGEDRRIRRTKHFSLQPQSDWECREYLENSEKHVLEELWKKRGYELKRNEKIFKREDV